MIIDLAIDATPHLPALAKAGVTGIIGYLNPHGTTGKVVTPQRAKAIAAAGMSLALVSEGWGDFAHGDISAAAGRRDAEHALASLPLLGAPKNSCVYFAVDTDASTSQIISLVVPYFKAAFEVLANAGYRVGAYGSGAVCNAALAAQVCDLAWLAAPTGWLGSREFLAGKKWTLHQGLPMTLAGIDCDPDVANGEDWGQFVPFAQGPQAANKTVVTQATAATPAPNPVLSLYDRQLDASTTAIHAILANGIHNFVAAWPSWAQFAIPPSLLGFIAPALGKAALDAILQVKEDKK